MVQLLFFMFHMNTQSHFATEIFYYRIKRLRISLTSFNFEKVYFSIQSFQNRELIIVS